MKKVPLKRKTPLKRKKGLKNRKPYEKKIPVKKKAKKRAKAKKKPLRRVSDKRKKDLALYKIERIKYLQENPVCEFDGCNKSINNSLIDLHHKIGRTGSRLYDNRYFCTLCREHHDACHKNPKMARELNLIIDLDYDEEVKRRESCNIY